MNEAPAFRPLAPKHCRSTISPDAVAGVRPRAAEFWPSSVPAAEESAAELKIHRFWWLRAVGFAHRPRWRARHRKGKDWNSFAPKSTKA